MKKGLFITATLIFSLYLTGCARNNVNNDIANRDTGRDPASVNYQTPGPGANRPGITRTDVNDNAMNRDVNRRIDNDTNDIRYTPNTAGTDHSRMRVADRASDKVARLPEVEGANVIVSYNNAYVAAKLKPSAGNRISSDVKDKISKAVKSTDRNIDNVYVSVNPDFYDRMNTYASDIRNGKPVSGFFNQFTDTIRRIFPEAR